jgi:D-galactarolactone cycloisomerase
VKLKIGGRMSRNADAAPGRTERLVALARKTWGDRMVIQVDANGSYDAKKGIEVGRMLEAHGVYFYEEPCPWEDFESTREVARALRKVRMAGGEQDTSFEKFHWLARNRALSILQPDLTFNGGFVRTTQVARIAAAYKAEITPHAPQPGFSRALLAQFGAITPNLGAYQEYGALVTPPVPWMSIQLEVKDGMLPVPTGPGFGVDLDPAYLKRAALV